MTFLAAALENWGYVAAERHGFAVKHSVRSIGGPAIVDKVEEK
jgi:hypothetical protein